MADDEYNEELDHMGPGEEEDEGDMEYTGEAVGDGTKASLDVPTALGLTEAPKPSVSTQQLLLQHPEIHPDYEEVVLEKLIMQGAYPPFKNDPTNSNHQSAPFLTIYERAKILSLRASQLAHGANPFIEVPEDVITPYDIAKAELTAKRLPFIVKRSKPDGSFEFWRLSDLMLL